MEKAMFLAIIFTIIAFFFYKKNDAKEYQYIKSNNTLICIIENEVLFQNKLLKGVWIEPGLFSGTDKNGRYCTLKFDLVASDFPEAMPNLEIEVDIWNELQRKYDKYKMYNCKPQ